MTEPEPQRYAMDDRDPSNSEIEELVEPLEPDDNVFTLVNPVQEVREVAPVHDPIFQDGTEQS